MPARAIMFQGTASDAGKSLITAGMCRALVRRGHSVRPFKPQNMSNNAAVTADGGEIGRAQALQARAAGVAPTVDMNPVLLKPQSDVGSQLVVRGEVRGNFVARAFQDLKSGLMDDVLGSYEQLRSEADFVVVEGAGGAAEINLRKNDIANMGFALAANVPVVLVADIDRGGVIANLVGTWDLLPADERKLISGYIINRFRGDPTLFEDGLKIITERTNFASFGIMPFVDAARRLPQEDAMSLENRAVDQSGGVIRIAVPQLAHISNFDDFDPLIAEPDVELIMVPRGEPLPGDADAVILPGSKATISDLEDFRAQGWHIDLSAHVRRGGGVLGICGGYQMLGGAITDPDGIEGTIGEVEGLGYLDVMTRLTSDKTLTEISGTGPDNVPFTGYEMHVGETTGPGLEHSYLSIDGQPHGARSDSRHVSGCYVHGLFTNDVFRHHFLNELRSRDPSGVHYEASIDAALDELAAAMENNLDLDRLIDAAV